MAASTEAMTIAPATMTDQRMTVVRSLARGAGLLAFTVALLGCSSSNDSAATLPPVGTVGATAPADPTTTALPLATELPTTTLAPVDGVALLQSSVDALAAGYHFTTTITVDGALALSADGDKVGDGTRLVIDSNGAQVSYVILPAGTWVLPVDGDWEQLEAAPSTDPITALRTPQGVTVDANDGTTVQLTATVPSVSLGIPGDASVTVQVTVVGGAISAITYNADVDGKPGVVQAAIGPIVDGTPVTPPV